MKKIKPSFLLPLVSISIIPVISCASTPQISPATQTGEAEDDFITRSQHEENEKIKEDEAYFVLTSDEYQTITQEVTENTIAEETILNSMEIKESPNTITVPEPSIAQVKSVPTSPVEEDIQQTLNSSPAELTAEEIQDGTEKKVIPSELSATGITTQEAEAEQEKISEPQEDIKPSRSMEVKKNQYLDVTYPGSSWLYLGEVDDTGLVRYAGRTSGDGDTIFSLRVAEEGKGILHFYKNDPLTGENIDDYLEITVSGTSTNPIHVEAPLYMDYKAGENVHSAQSDVISHESEVKDTYTTSSDKTESLVQDRESDSKSSSLIQTADNTSTYEGTPAAQKEVQKLSADELLSQAENFYAQKDFENALKYLTAFFDKAVTKLDHGYFLKGEILESNSSVRDIKKAMEAYQKIINDYPQSILWQRASEKVTYLKRFYFNIR